jgi:transcriptional regulator with XRE-family HTH domain
LRVRSHITQPNMDTPLKQARLRRGLKQSEVAEAVGIGTSQFCRIERCTSGASRVIATKLAAFFGPDELTREQILYPEEYVNQPPPQMPVQSVLAA